MNSSDDFTGGYVFCSEAMRRVNAEIDRLARFDFDVLIVGETGVGKDVAAIELHRRSKRANSPFIPVPITSFNETLIESELFGHEKGAFSDAYQTKVGLLESADGGIIYLPEISSLPERIQLKLLQFMQYKTVSRVGQDPRKPLARLDVRLIMATNEDLTHLVKSGSLRRDFFHRITGVRLEIPPLRHRPGDIEVMAQHFLKKFGDGGGEKVGGFTPAALALLRSHTWLGNVRELENVMKNAIAHANGPVLTPDCFPDLKPSKPEAHDTCVGCLMDQCQTLPPYHELEIEFRRAYFLAVLRRAGMNVTKAARLAGITSQGFRRALKALGIEISSSASLTPPMSTSKSA